MTLVWVAMKARRNRFWICGRLIFCRPVPLEVIEGLEHREPGVPDPPLDAAAFAHRRFALDQLCQIIQMRELLRGSLCRHGLVMLPDIGQLQAPQLGFE